MWSSVFIYKKCLLQFSRATCISGMFEWYFYVKYLKKDILKKKNKGENEGTAFKISEFHSSHRQDS